MRVLLVAEEAAGIQMLRSLEQREHEIVAVVAEPRDDQASRSTMWRVARANGYETWAAGDVRSAAMAERLRTAEVDVALNVHSLYHVEPSVLGASRFGWYNLHPGRLPDYAGLNTVSWAIYNGETEHAVTVHRMVAAIDAGPIAYEEAIPIEIDDTGLTLSAKSVRVGVRLMERLVDALAHDPDSVPAIAQDPRELRYFHSTDVPQDGRLVWDAPARRVYDTIRAFDYHPLPSPLGHPRADLAGQEVGVIGASLTGKVAPAPPGRIEARPDGAIDVACGDEWITVRSLEVDDHVAPAADVIAARPLAEGGRGT